MRAAPTVGDDPVRLRIELVDLAHKARAPLLPTNCFLTRIGMLIIRIRIIANDNGSTDRNHSYSEGTQTRAALRSADVAPYRDGQAGGQGRAEGYSEYWARPAQP